MSTQVDFTQTLKEAGIPTTEAAITEALEAAVKDSGSKIANDRAMSPFWRLVKAVVVTPVLWLTNTLVAKHVLPAMFVSTARGIYLELKGKDVEITRLPASHTVGRLTAHKTDPDVAVIILAGSRIETLPIDGKVYAVEVIADTQLPAGESSGFVECQATEPGQGHNLSAGYYNRLITPIDGITQIVNEPDWIVHPGQDAEDDDALSLRIRNRYGAAGHYHIDAVYRDIVATQAGIRVDHMFFEHDAPRGPGSANCYIFMPVGDVPEALLVKVNAHIAAGYHGHGDDMCVMAMPHTDITLRGQYWPKPDAAPQDVATLSEALTQRIKAAFRQSDAFDGITRVWPMSTFSISQLIAELHRDLPALGGLRFDHQDIVSARALPVLALLTLEEVSHGA